MPGFNELIQGEQPVLVDFSAEWCGPCKMMAPILREVAPRLEGKIRIIKVDIDQAPSAAARFNVRSVPTLMLFRKGQVLWRQSGVMPAKELENMLLVKTN